MSAGLEGIFDATKINHEKLQERELERIRCNDRVYSCCDFTAYFYSGRYCRCVNMVSKAVEKAVKKAVEAKDKEYARLIFLMQDRHLERERNG